MKRFGLSLMFLVPVFGLALVIGACSDDDPVQPPSPGLPEGVVADFSAPDVNPSSPTGGETVSPRDYLGSVSAWYFGHST